MKHYIIYNKKNSFADLNLAIVGVPKIPITNEKVEREGKYIIKTGEYDELILSLKFRLKEGSVWDRQDFILDWLYEVECTRLIISVIPTKYYIVKNIEVGNIEEQYFKYGYFEVQFTLEPFKYLVEEKYITLTETKTIIYNGTVSGECKIKVYGSGNIQLTMNDEIIQINNVNEYVELDSKLLLCLNQDLTSKSIDMTGGFFVLTRGNNNISWTGNISKLEILPRTAFR